jgi:hypothetical protein
MQPREVLPALVNSMEKTLRKEKGENLAGQTLSLGVKQREEAAGRTEARPNPEEGGETLKKRKQTATASHAVRRRKRGYPRRPDGKKNKRKKPEARRRRVKRTSRRRYQDRKGPLSHL